MQTWTSDAPPELNFETTLPSGDRFKFKVTEPTTSVPQTVLTLYKFVDGSFQQQGGVMSVDGGLSVKDMLSGIGAQL